MRVRLLIAMILLGLSISTVAAQELLLRGTAESPKEQHEESPGTQPLPDMDYTHPALSDDGSWAGLMTGLVIVFFIMAALVGVLTDIDRRFDAHLAVSDAPTSADRHHGRAH